MTYILFSTITFAVLSMKFLSEADGSSSINSIPVYYHYPFDYVMHWTCTHHRHVTCSSFSCTGVGVPTSAGNPGDGGRDSFGTGKETAFVYNAGRLAYVPAGGGGGGCANPRHGEGGGARPVGENSGSNLPAGRAEDGTVTPGDEKSGKRSPCRGGGSAVSVGGRKGAAIPGLGESGDSIPGPEKDAGRRPGRGEGGDIPNPLVLLSLTLESLSARCWCAVRICRGGTLRPIAGTSVTDWVGELS